MRWPDWFAAIGAMLLVVVSSCAALRSARVGGMTGYVDGTDGHRDINAVTLSVEPLAGLKRPEPERRVHPGAWVPLAEHEAAVGVLTKQRDEYAERLDGWEGHACDPGDEHLPPPEGGAWWREPETFLYVAGALITLLGAAFGVKKVRQIREAS